MLELDAAGPVAVLELLAELDSSVVVLVPEPIDELDGEVVPVSDLICDPVAPLLSLCDEREPTLPISEPLTIPPVPASLLPYRDLSAASLVPVVLLELIVELEDDVVVPELIVELRSDSPCSGPTGLEK
jgi:hypothetical protein